MNSRLYFLSVRSTQKISVRFCLPIPNTKKNEAQSACFEEKHSVPRKQNLYGILGTDARQEIMIFM